MTAPKPEPVAWMVETVDPDDPRPGYDRVEFQADFDEWEQQGCKWTPLYALPEVEWEWGVGEPAGDGTGRHVGIRAHSRQEADRMAAAGVTVMRRLVGPWEAEARQHIEALLAHSACIGSCAGGFFAECSCGREALETAARAFLDREVCPMTEKRCRHSHLRDQIPCLRGVPCPTCYPEVKHG